MQPTYLFSELLHCQILVKHQHPLSQLSAPVGQSIPAPVPELFGEHARLVYVDHYFVYPPERPCVVHQSAAVSSRASTCAPPDGSRGISYLLIGRCVGQSYHHLFGPSAVDTHCAATLSLLVSAAARHERALSSRLFALTMHQLAVDTTRPALTATVYSAAPLSCCSAAATCCSRGLPVPGLTIFRTAANCNLQACSNCTKHHQLMRMHIQTTCCTVCWRMSDTSCVLCLQYSHCCCCALLNTEACVWIELMSFSVAVSACCRPR